MFRSWQETTLNSPMHANGRGFQGSATRLAKHGKVLQLDWNFSGPTGLIVCIYSRRNGHLPIQLAEISQLAYPLAL